ncbi:MAG: hypothetical protein RQ801_12125, partial [Spirochaetaceae bacterium]|nr:hypothetical protein [Spirochaetaceae bacterium]
KTGEESGDDSGGRSVAGIDSGVVSGVSLSAGSPASLAAAGGAIPGVAQDVITNTARPMRIIRELVKIDCFFTSNRVPFGTA